LPEKEAGRKKRERREEGEEEEEKQPDAFTFILILDSHSG